MPFNDHDRSNPLKAVARISGEPASFATSRAMCSQLLSCGWHGWLILGLGLLLVDGFCVSGCYADDNAMPYTADEFETQIRPILATQCVKCHGEQKQEGGLRLDTREAILKGGESGPAVVPSHADQSLLMEAVRYEGLEMPPNGRLRDKQIRKLQRWIDMGMLWPENSKPLREDLAEITVEDRQWWAFQPVHRPVTPDVEGDRWPTNYIDRFVLHRLNAAKLTHAPYASQQTLVRRVYFDLTGLPPSAEALKAFEDDSAENSFEDAWKNLVERLLADPSYGEHWARFWLDVVRYAESDGWNQDAYRPNIWRYRDYVINAFNSDKPYPDFVREQLAGDEIREDNPEHLAAAGYLRLGIYEYNQRDARGLWNDSMNEMTDVTGDAFLGLSMGCAKCHDHKFDPILQADYFRLRAFLEPVIWRDDIIGATEAEKQEYQKQFSKWEEATQSIREQIGAIIKPYHDRKWKSTADKFPLDIQECFYKPVAERTSWEHQMAYLVSRQFEEEGGGPLKGMKKEHQEKYDALHKELATFDHIKPKALPELMTVTDFEGTAAPTLIPDVPGAAPIEPGYPVVMMPDASAAIAQMKALPKSTGRRTELARWIGDGNNPLTMRVFVNRIWQQHFGQGIAATTSDFGRLGTPPTHPELLDWLVKEFVEHDFSTRHLHRQILTSATWQQSAHHPDAARQQAIDPSDNLLWRSRIRRLSAEQIRDAMLTCSGELQQSLGGPSVDTETPRRAVYVKSFRNTPDAFMAVFDIANGLQSTSERTSTTTPVQSLLMINGDYPLGRAMKFAERIAKAHSTPTEQAVAAIEMAWGRRPTADELEWSLGFLTPS
ncbi:MAG: PSD1 and planctomycete cytochrome C domain-containing protein, partial [Planctomycetota bacterium]|nr:PSD1 and planctomycete cytochrome C domain-containing protein [Planctomycetota bacterium]